MDCSPPGFSVYVIFQARVLEWGAIAFSGYFVLVTAYSQPLSGLTPGITGIGGTRTLMEECPGQACPQAPKCQALAQTVFENVSSNKTNPALQDC